MDTDKLWSKEFILANMIQFGVNIGYFILYSTIGIYTRGLTNVELYVGIVTGIFTFAALGTRMISGQLLDHMSHKSILLFGVSLSLLASAGYLLSNTVPLLMGMRILNGLGYGLSSAAIATMISSMIPSRRLLEGLGYSMMMMTLCGALGPAIGLNVSHSDYRQFGMVFVITLGFAVLTLFLALSIKSKKIVFSAERGTLELGLQKQNAVTLATVIMLVLTFLVGFSHATVVACLNLYALDSNLGNMSSFFIIFAAANFVTRLFMNQVFHIMSERIVMIGITVLLILVYLGIFAAQEAIWIYLLAAPFGMIMGFYYPLLTTKTIKTMSQFRQGTSNSIYLASEDIAFALGAVFWSGISVYIGGYRQIYLIAAFLVVLMLLIVLFYPTVLRKYQIKEEQW